MISQLRQQIKSLEQKIKNIQEECNHPKSAVTSVYLGVTGQFNEDRRYKNTCQLCEKVWNTDALLH